MKRARGDVEERRDINSILLRRKKRVHGFLSRIADQSLGATVGRFLDSTNRRKLSAHELLPGYTGAKSLHPDMIQAAMERPQNAATEIDKLRKMACGGSNNPECLLQFWKDLVSSPHFDVSLLPCPSGKIEIPQNLSVEEFREVVLAFVRLDSQAWRKMPLFWKNDREVVLVVVKQDEQASDVLEYAAAKLKKDQEIVLAAVKQNGYALEYADRS